MQGLVFPPAVAAPAFLYDFAAGGNRGVIVELNSATPRKSVGGLELFLLEEASKPVSAVVYCDDQDLTPSLQVNADIYGTDAKLINLTSTVSGCDSYSVAVAMVSPIGSPLERNVQLGISMHVPGVNTAGSTIDSGVFVFNPVHGNWSKAQPPANARNNEKQSFATLGEGVQRIIGGVIATPKALEGQAALNTPSALAEPLQQVSPTNGYLGIDTVEPNNKGGYSVELPLLLRPSRGPGPSFSVSYDPQGGMGALGRGWDLRISSIEVRGPAPLYHPQYETEDYVLDGVDLIALDEAGADLAPLYKGGPIIPRVSGVRYFRPRNSTNGLIVKRSGLGPNAYYWEVWDPNSHVTKLYGAELVEGEPAVTDNGVLRGGVVAASGKSMPVIGQWGLTQEFDSQPARSGASYHYLPGKDACGPLNGDCVGALRLERAEYNQAFGSIAGAKPEPTSLYFEWRERRDHEDKPDDENDKDRVTSDGRLGFFRAHAYWLEAIEVRYRQQAMPAQPLPLTMGGDILFSRHIFGLNKPTECVNFDKMLETYTVMGNADYDGNRADALTEQTFTFTYEGQRNCKEEWLTAELEDDEDGDAPAVIPGTLGFPGDLLNRENIGSLGRQSLLGTGQEEQTGGSLYAGIGPTGYDGTKNNSVGLKAGVSHTRTEGNSTLLDVTGDGLVDVVFRNGEGRLNYCAGVRSFQAETATITFPPTRCGSIHGVSEFAGSQSSTESVGFEGYGGGAMGGVGFNSSDSETDIYLVDRDGDGLIDVASHGQILYGQGEDIARRIVSFEPNSALLPPLPGRDEALATSAADAHVPRELRATISHIERKVAALSRRLAELDQTQTTIAWEAPLDGAIRLVGRFTADVAPPHPQFGYGAYRQSSPDDFQKLKAETHVFDGYLAEKANCTRWPEEEECHSSKADPLAAAYVPVQAEFDFVTSPPQRVWISLARKFAPEPNPAVPSKIADPVQAVECGAGQLAGGVLEIGHLNIGSACRGSAPEGQIRVRAGDVLYVSYSAGPHFASYIRPNVHVTYEDVDDDSVFRLAKAGDPDGVLGKLPCKWQEHAGGATDCILSRQQRYEFDLSSGTLTTSPNQSTVLPPGTKRELHGRFEIPTQLTADYQVSYEFLARPMPYPTDFQNLPRLPMLPVAELPLLHGQDISKACANAGPVCVVDIELCGGCLDDPAQAYQIATRLSVMHRVTNAAGASELLRAYTIDGQLSGFRWLEAPHFSTEVTELAVDQTGTAVDLPPQDPVDVYLPVTMGTADTEHFRIKWTNAKDGNYANPDTGLSPSSPTINLEEMLELERQSAELARIRQTLALCAYGEQLLTFAGDRMTVYGAGYTGDYASYWRVKLDAFKQRCDDANTAFYDRRFTGGHRPEVDAEEHKDALALTERLARLPLSQQLTSAETLLERVLGTLALGGQVLMDDPRLTRRGYRLPVKVNPFECAEIAAGMAPFDSPILAEGGVGDCAYRLASNFAMQTFEELEPSLASSLKLIFSQLEHGGGAAFKIEMMATVNGLPVALRKLSGAESANQRCEPQPMQKSCLAAYGTIGPEAYFHPPARRQSGAPIVFDEKGEGEGEAELKLSGPTDQTLLHGDVFQRVTANKRVGRAVSFQNGIMDDQADAICQRDYPANSSDLAEMEAKQDCTFGDEPLVDEDKYEGTATYAVTYEINENNEFNGRNWVYEFRARPLDVVELHYRLVPSTVQFEVQDDLALKGSFSTVTDGNTRWIFPRSPAQILPGSAPIKCPKVPKPANGASAIINFAALTVECRPFTQLAWAETFLGAQYRTYSDAQATGNAGEFSIKRRRDMMRLQPEIEVDADRYDLDDQIQWARAGSPPTSPAIRSLQDLVAEVNRTEKSIRALVPNYKREKLYYAHFLRDPAVTKVGDAWAFFAGRLTAAAPNSMPTFASLRERLDRLTAATGPVTADSATNACGTKDAPNPLDKCRAGIGAAGETVVTLEGVNYFGLKHRFVAPARQGIVGPPAASEHPALNCVSEVITIVSSCWVGIDDTVAIERAVNAEPNQAAIAGSSALMGLERPPVVAFIDGFRSYQKVACNDPAMPKNTCADSSVAVPAVASATAYPHRPGLPATARRLPLFAPIETFSTESVTFNAGVDRVHANLSLTRRRAGTFMQDVNGDGYPDIVSGGVAELTSPVGMARQDWWTYYRTSGPVSAVGPGRSQRGVGTGARSESKGVGATPATFSVYDAGGAGAGTESFNAKVNIGGDIQLGKDLSTTELIDLNGDGIADSVSVSVTSGTITSVLSAGNRLRAGASHFLPASASVPPPKPEFGASRTIGLGIRLGFSVASDSIGGGIGVEARDSGAKAVLVDFTGDQRPDIVEPSGDGLYVFPNLGNGFSHVGIKYDVLPGDFLSRSQSTLVDSGAFATWGFDVAPWFKVVFSVAGQLAHGSTRTLMSLRDVNGDGVPDVTTVTGADLGGLVPGGAPITQIRYNPTARRGLLATITNPSGSRLGLKHGLFGNTGPEHGSHVWALTDVARYDGVESNDLNADPPLPRDGEDVLLAHYDYSQGYYNRAERAFYGFARRSVTLYGCDLMRAKCWQPLLALDAPTPSAALLGGDGAVPLQRIDEEYANGDYYTQGTLLKQTVSGKASKPDLGLHPDVLHWGPGKELPDRQDGAGRNRGSDPPDAVRPAKEVAYLDRSGDAGWTVVSRRSLGYSIDKPDAVAGYEATGNEGLLSSSGLAPPWTADSGGVNGKVLGTDSDLCGLDVGDCNETLLVLLTQHGFTDEQAAFWRQRSAAVRQRFVKLESFGAGDMLDTTCFDEPTNYPGKGTVNAQNRVLTIVLGCDPIGVTGKRLRSAVGYDTDQWGQVLRFYSVGEALQDWTPVNTSSAHATTDFAKRDGSAGPGHPLLGLARVMQVHAGPWPSGGAPPIRMREATFSEDGHGNLTNLCLYPGGTPFKFEEGTCERFRMELRTALEGGYYNPHQAIRQAYERTPGLPKGQASFNAIMLHQVRSYDAFGNITHAISPLSGNQEWVERRYSYDRDPFRRTATATMVSRCVDDVPGAGVSSSPLPSFDSQGCHFGLAAIGGAVQRREISQASFVAIDAHFGVPSTTRDINGNSILFDFDRWGRLSLLARSWGQSPRETKTFAADLNRAFAKRDPAANMMPSSVDDWRILAAIDYGRQKFDAEGPDPFTGAVNPFNSTLLRSTVRRFERSEAYSGLLGNATTREVTTYADGLGRPLQTLKEADVCQDPVLTTDHWVDLEDRCKASTAIVTPGDATDALGRVWASFQPYPTLPRNKRRHDSSVLFAAPDLEAWAIAEPTTQTSYDGAGRPTQVDNRLARGGRLRGSTQLSYGVANDSSTAAARFRTFTISPRCTASAILSDARGLATDTFEDQLTFYGPQTAFVPPTDTEDYPGRDPETIKACFNLVDDDDNDVITTAWDKGHTARVSYQYDELSQLKRVDYPLVQTAKVSERQTIALSYDLIGRNTALNDPDSGCTSYAYDGLGALTSQLSYRYEPVVDARCGTSSEISNEKSYTYSGGRLLGIDYRSLSEQGGPVDRADSVRFYLDRYPYAALPGEVLEALNFVPNEQANQRFIDATGRNCVNCIGQVAIVSDRSGALSFAYDELGLATRELRSIVAPVTEVKHSEGDSETYLPEIAFYEQNTTYTSFGDILRQQFDEQAPMNPSTACLELPDGVAGCLAHFSLGWRYGPDGALAQQLFNGTPLVSAANDALGRPSVRWTSDGTRTTYAYADDDLRLNRSITLTAAGVPVLNTGYQYDGGGNILAYGNFARPDRRKPEADAEGADPEPPGYASSHAFRYDPANRLVQFHSLVEKADPDIAAGPAMRRLVAAGNYAFDAGHRLVSRGLTIDDKVNPAFSRSWTYSYDNNPATGPVHAPQGIDFGIGDNPSRTSAFRYDDLGRMIGIALPVPADGKAANDNLIPVLTNRALRWDGEGRPVRIRGVADAAVPHNVGLLREDYVYDFGGNRTIRMTPKLKAGENAGTARDEVATIYMTPYYARPYDGPGTVQLSNASLPTATLRPPASQGETPVVTYLYSDLSVGSVTASVTSYGEPNDTAATFIARREYEPFGLELTGNALAANGALPPNVFHGKELDLVTGFSSFGARSYSRDLGIWLSPDPMRHKPAVLAELGVSKPKGTATFTFNNANPVLYSDRDGNNPGMCYSGYYSCVDFTTGNWLVDNGPLGAVNLVLNAPPSIFNAGIDILAPVAHALEPYQGDLDALAMYPWTALEARALSTSMKFLVVAGRVRAGSVAQRLTWAGLRGIDAFEVAESGGKHAGFLRNYATRSDAEIAKGIASLEKQIAKHQAAIANPTSKVPNFYDLLPKRQQHLLGVRWPADIARQREEAAILRGILDRRK